MDVVFPAILETLAGFVDTIIILGLVATAVIVTRSRTMREDRAALANLVDTRGKTIQDLQDELKRQSEHFDETIKTLQQRISRLEGQYEALKSVKADEIAEIVLVRLEKFFNGREGKTT